MWTTYWWIIDDEENNIYNEEIFTEVKHGKEKDHREFLSEVFPNKKLFCMGKISKRKAKKMQLIGLKKTLDNSYSL